MNDELLPCGVRKGLVIDEIENATAYLELLRAALAGCVIEETTLNGWVKSVTFGFTRYHSSAYRVRPADTVQTGGPFFLCDTRDL